MKTIITILFILLTPLAFGQTKDKYDKYLDSLMAKGQYDELIKFFEKELKKYSENEDVLRSLGYVHIVKNNLDLGEKYYSQALLVNPKCARCYLNIGRVYSLRGDNKKALEYIDKGAALDPADALIYSDRAMLKEALGDRFGALQDHNKAIEIDSKNFDYYVKRGLFYSSEGSSSLSISDLTKAIELAPNNYYPYFRRADIYYTQRRVNEALKDINKAIELDSNQSSLYTARGAIFDVLKKHSKAIEDYSKAISLNKEDYLPYLNRVSSYYDLEDLDAACSDYLILNSLIEKEKIDDQAIVKEIKVKSQDICDSTRPSYYFQRGVAFYNLKQYQDAVDIYTKCLSKFPGNALALSFRGNAYMALGEYQKAIDSYYSSLNFKDNTLAEIKSNPNFVDASTQQITNFYNASLGMTYLSIAESKTHLGLFNEALTEINIALELIPDLKDFNKEAGYNVRGYIYLSMGKYEQAIADFNTCIQINKDFPLAYVNRAIAKVSSTEKVKLTSFSITSNFKNQPVNVNWDLPNAALKKSESNMLSALKDCSKAIEIDYNLGFAYYIRGQIKQMLLYGDYCQDLLTAKKFGLAVEDRLLINCRR